MTPTIIPPACGREVRPRFGPSWTCSEDLRCNRAGCVTLGDALVGAGCSCYEFSDAWAAVLAWNLTFGALLGAAAQQVCDAAVAWSRP